MSDKELLARQSAMLQEIVRQREQKRDGFEGHPPPGDAWCKETAYDVYAGDIMNEGKRRSSSHSDIGLSKRQNERITSIIKIPPSIEALQLPAKKTLKKGLFKINQRQYLRIHSRRRARDAIANNRAIHVRCSVCEKRFQIEESTRLLFCTNCKSLSTLFSKHDRSFSNQEGRTVPEAAVTFEQNTLGVPIDETQESHRATHRSQTVVFESLGGTELEILQQNTS
mmetsp:Transcript_9118/g.14025  ORF Transcript_9118/g.14025 Transcript_9118/m.14025 type:complete len:225 (-) Transcript_9118:200-874(-)